MNYPKDCQSGSRLPWNEPEGIECECGSAMTLEYNELTCDRGCE